MTSKRDGVKNLTDDELDRLLVDGHGADEVLGRYLARLRDIGVTRPEPDVAGRHLDAITSEVEKIRDGSPFVSRRSLSRRIRLVVTGIPLLIRRRLAPRNVMVGFATALMTAGMAAAATGNLPAPAQDLISKSLALVGIDIPSAESAATELTEVGSPAPVVGDVGQGQDGADKPAVAEPTIPAESRFRVVPTIQPEPSEGGLDNPEPSVPTPPVPPEEPGTAVEEPQDPEPPVDAPDEQPGIGPPANPGPPDHAGPPDNPGPPANPGPPDHAGPPDNPGPPANPGPPDHAGPPANPGPPDDAGSGKEPGKPQSQSRQGNGSG
jgi:hypothetical protein